MLYRLSLSTVKRSSGRSSVSASAYRSGFSLRDARQAKTFSYKNRRKRDRIRRTALLGWSGSREDLWNAAEHAERRKDAITARECLLTLFPELDEDTNWALALAFSRWLRFFLGGVAIDVALHSAKVGPHAHILFTTRKISEAGEFGARTCLDELKGRGPAAVSAMRAAWCDIANEALQAAGLPRLEHRAGAARNELWDLTQYEPTRARTPDESHRGEELLEIARPPTPAR
jgi:hypothetical protein